MLVELEGKLYISDEGYTTENENNYEKFDRSKDDSDDWDVETDNETYEEDLDQNTHNEKKDLNSNPAPVRHQTVLQVFTSILELVKLIFYNRQRMMIYSPRYLQQQLL